MTHTYEEVTIHDYSSYVSGKSNNGGCYSYSTSYIWDREQGKYKVIYGTSAQFQYCDGCGKFSDCNCDYSTVDEDIVKQSIDIANKKDKFEVEIKYSDENE